MPSQKERAFKMMSVRKLAHCYLYSISQPPSLRAAYTEGGTTRWATKRVSLIYKSENKILQVICAATTFIEAGLKTTGFAESMANKKTLTSDYPVLNMRLVFLP